MSNAAHALPARLRAAAGAIANARSGRRGAPVIANVLDLLPTKLFDEVVEDARAALEAADALPPEPRKAGPLNAVDASALALDLGARVLVIVASDQRGVRHAVVWGAGNATAVLEPREADALMRAVAATLTVLEAATTPEPTP